ncbi:MAG: hypothetical protein ACIAQF_05015 [Phycisphaerales bacterium JB065]
MYPARTAVEPGQIWSLDDSGLDPVHNRPPELAVRPGKVRFATLSKTINGSLDFDAELTIVGKSSKEFQAALQRATVESVKLDFGDTETVTLWASELHGDNLLRYPAAYQDYITLIRSGDAGYIVLHQVVRTSGLIFRVKYDNKSSLVAEIPEIERIIGAKIAVQSDYGGQVVWKIEGDLSLAIGYRPVKTKDLIPASEKIPVNPSIKDEILRANPVLPKVGSG